MIEMFDHAKAFNQDLSSWNVTKVEICKDFSKDADAWTLPKPALTCQE